MKRSLIMIFVASYASILLSSCDTINNRTLEEYEVIDDSSEISSEQFREFLNLKSISFSNNIKTIKANAFANTEKLENVYFNGTLNDWCNIEFENEKSNPMYFAKNFYINSNNQYILLTSIKVPNSINTIKSYTFTGFDIDKLTIANNIKVFEENSFSHSNVADIYFDGTLAQWCDISFLNLTSSPIDETTGIYMKDESGEYYPILDTLYIPESVSEIHDYQFANFKMVNEIILPRNIKRIGKYAFLLKKDSIESLHYNGTLNDWLKIEFASKFSNPMELSQRTYMLNNDHDYYELTSLNTIVIDDTIEKLGDYQLSGITSFENLYLSKSVKKIGKNVLGSYDVLIDNLYYDGNITDWCNIEFSDKYTIISDINNIHFLGNENYFKVEKTIYIPGEVKNIKPFQFSGFRKVETFILQEGIENIEQNAFANCYALQGIVLPSSISSIKEDVFVECSKLSSIYYFGNQEQYKSIQMPKFDFDLYYYSEEEPTENGDYWHYDNNEIVIWE